MKKILVAAVATLINPMSATYAADTLLSKPVNIGTTAKSCEAHSTSLRAARREFSRLCGTKPLDCDPSNGGWLCSSTQIGSAAPTRAAIKQRIVYRIRRHLAAGTCSLLPRL